MQEPGVSETDFTVLDEPGYVRFLGPVMKAVTAQGVELRLAARPDHLNGGQVFHGGTMMSFADMVLEQTARTAANDRPLDLVSMTSEFCAAGLADMTLCGSGQMVRQTRTMLFLKAEIRGLVPATGAEKLLMVANGVAELREEAN